MSDERAEMIERAKVFIERQFRRAENIFEEDILDDKAKVLADFALSEIARLTPDADKWTVTKTNQGVGTTIPNDYNIHPTVTTGLACANCESKDREIERLRAALQKYADISNWAKWRSVNALHGYGHEIARDALGEVQK